MTAPSLVARWTAWGPRLQSVLRIVASFIFVQASTLKLFAFPIGMPPNGATAGEMAVAYFQFSLPLGFWPVANNGVTPALYCFLWLYCSAAGAGPWSLDAKRGK